MQDGINIDTPTGRFTFNIFASLAEFEREIIRDPTKAGLEAAKNRGCNRGGPKIKNKAVYAKEPAYA